MHRWKTFTMLLCLWAGFVALAGEAAGQDDPASAETAADESKRPDDDSRADDLVVTGQLLERELQETAESISIVDEATFEERGLFDMNDIYRQLPNVSEVNEEGFSIRGITQNSIATGGGAGELAAYLVDGVALTNFALRFAPNRLWDARQVEVLRGPQTTSIGRNALAGAVVVKTNDPVFTREFAGRARVGTAKLFGFSALANTPIGTDHAIRVAFDWDRSDGFVSNPTRGEDDYDRRRNLTARIKWLWEPESNDRFRLLLTVQYGQTRRGENLVSLDDPGARENFSNLPANEDLDIVTTGLDINYDLGGHWTLLSRTTFLYSEYERFDDADQSADGGNAFLSRDAKQRNITQEFRFMFDNKEGLRGVVGVYLGTQRIDSESPALFNISPADVGVPPPLLPFYADPLEASRDSTSKTDTDNIAIFTEWDKEINKWTIFAGLRWDYERFKNDSDQTIELITDLPDPANAPGGANGPIGQGIAATNAAILSQTGSSTFNSSTNYNAPIPSIGVSYDWTKDLRTSLFFKQGYRAGGAELTITGRENEYDPEILSNFEFSVRSRWLDGRLIANLNIYYGLWNDQQVSVQQSDNTFDVIIENAGESTIAGFEFDSFYTVTRWCYINASVGYAYTRFDKFESSQGDLTGNRFALAPEWTAALGVTFRPNESWRININATYRSESFADVQNTIQLDGFIVTNINVGYDYKSLSLNFYVNNVFDETYILFASQAPAGGLNGVVGNPRTFVFELVYRF
ncbi:MAG: TonB-dependent receptor [Planctomycetota bacterium]